MVFEQIYVIMGVASRLPVAAFTDQQQLKEWLASRRGLTMLRLFCINNNEIKELDVTQFNA